MIGVGDVDAKQRVRAMKTERRMQASQFAQRIASLANENSLAVPQVLEEFPAEEDHLAAFASGDLIDAQPLVYQIDIIKEVVVIFTSTMKSPIVTV